MPATKTESSVAPNITQASLIAGIKSAMAATGYSSNPFDEYTSGTDRFLVYQITFDAAKTYGVVYLQIKVTSALAVAQRLYTGWDAVAHTGTNPGTETAVTGATFASNIQIDFLGLAKSPEFRIVGIYQGNTYCFLGYLRPENKPTWWDENSFPYCFIPLSSSNWLTWYTAGITPYTGSLSTSGRVQSNFTVSQMANVNPITNRRDIVSGLMLFAASNEGIAGRTSNDVAMVSATGLARRDAIQVAAGVEEYLLLLPTAGGPAIRTI